MALYFKKRIECKGRLRNRVSNQNDRFCFDTWSVEPYMGRGRAWKFWGNPWSFTLGQGATVLWPKAQPCSMWGALFCSLDCASCLESWLQYWYQTALPDRNGTWSSSSHQSCGPLWWSIAHVQSRTWSRCHHGYAPVYTIITYPWPGQDDYLRSHLLSVHIKHPRSHSHTSPFFQCLSSLLLSLKWFFVPY